MTEQEWCVCTSPQAMVKQIEGRASDRKLRLFACAFCRHIHIWKNWLLDERSRKAVETTERFLQGKATQDELDSARAAAGQPVRNPILRQGRAQIWTDRKVNRVAWSTTTNGQQAAVAALRARYKVEEEFLCHLLRDLFGPLPFRRVSLSPTILAWNDGTLRRLAQGMYEERQLPEGALEPVQMDIFADALEDAGCTDMEILGHCRSREPHFQGCWVLDLALEKPLISRSRRAGEP